jgi:CRISPR-associated protein Csb1
MDDKTFSDLISHAVALRLRVRLQPAAGPGAKVAPPTYNGPVYATELRYFPDIPTPVPCVLLDSPASQANRIEQALLAAWRRKELSLPIVYSDFTPYDPPAPELPPELRLLRPIGKLTSLDTPHRIADAILRDSIVPEEGRVFRSLRPEQESSWGQQLRMADIKRARILYELCPTALLLGMWDSTIGAGPTGLRIERALSSEIVGVDIMHGVHTRGRRDPLSIEDNLTPVYRARPSHPVAWTVSPETAQQVNGTPLPYGQGHPAEINHGPIPPTVIRGSATVGAGGITMRYAEMLTVISLTALRRFSFPAAGAESSPPETDQAGQSVLAALGILGVHLMLSEGLDLRSQCLLVPEQLPVWEAVSPVGEITTLPALDLSTARTLFEHNLKKAIAAGLIWRSKPLRLVPTEDLVRLVVVSQRSGPDRKDVPDGAPEAASGETETAVTTTRSGRGRQRKAPSSGKTRNGK